MPISKEDDKSSWEQYHKILLSHKPLLPSRRNLHAAAMAAQSPATAERHHLLPCSQTCNNVTLPEPSQRIAPPPEEKRSCHPRANLADHRDAPPPLRPSSPRARANQMQRFCVATATAGRQRVSVAAPHTCSVTAMAATSSNLFHEPDPSQHRKPPRWSSRRQPRSQGEECESETLILERDTLHHVPASDRTVKLVNSGQLVNWSKYAVNSGQNCKYG